MLNGITQSKIIDETFYNQTVTVRGRIYHKEINSDTSDTILYIRDDNGLLTCIINKEISGLTSLTLETFVKITGIIQKAPFRTFTPYVLLGSHLELLSELAEPIDPLKKVLSSIRFLYIRKPEIKYLLLIKRKIKKYLVEFLEGNGFEPVDTPIITSFTQINRQAFKITTSNHSELSEKDNYLIQKSQFYLEAFAHAFGKVYTLTPAFRADHRDTNLLLAEFRLLEVEEIFSSMTEQMDLLEQAIKYTAKKLLNDLDLFKQLITFRSINKFETNNITIHKLPESFWESINDKLNEQKVFLENIDKPFPRMKYKDVFAILKEKEEYSLGTHLREKRGDIITSSYSTPVFVYEWPFDLRHFFDKKCPKNTEYTHTFDLLAHGFGEISSGGEKEYRSTQLDNQIKEKKLRKENNQTLQWYHKLQKFGSVSHAGFSIGVEKICAWLTKTEQINDTVGFPRRIVGKEIHY